MNHWPIILCITINMNMRRLAVRMELKPFYYRRTVYIVKNENMFQSCCTESLKYNVQNWIYNAYTLHII